MSMVLIMPAILIVDDDTDLRDALAEVFAAAGYAVTTAANGREALACLDEHRPDVILLDMMMPVMDGREFLKRKRARPAVADIPVIVASASTSDEVPGATAMFDKPCDVEKLLRTVAGIVHPASAPRHRRSSSLDGARS
jgi:CheY-like chemotaxis protein